jgi:hypothetical protein
MRKAFISMLLLALGGASPVAAQVPGIMDLTVAREGSTWRVDARFNAGGQELSNPVRDLTVQGNEIAFATTILGTEARFSGRLGNDSLTGTIEGLQRSAGIASGTWNLVRQKPGLASDGLSGNWMGSFIIHLSPQSLPPQKGWDVDFDARVARPAYVEQHPRVLFDEGHNNAGASAKHYRAFVDLITSDGYRVSVERQAFTKSVLSRYDLVIIVNAAGPHTNRAAQAFSEEECDALRDWVSGGGALLLITDHAPYSAAVAGLSKRFAFEISNGYTIDASHHNTEAGDLTELVFTREDGLVGEHAITQGRDPGERINRVMTFSGTSLKGPPGSVAILKLGDTAMDVVPPDRGPASPDQPAPDHKPVSAEGRAQGAAFSFGSGRVVVLCEAAMLSAQVTPQGVGFGMSVPGNDNRQLALNIVRWLSGLFK